MAYDHPDWQLEIWRGGVAHRIAMDGRESLRHLAIFADALASTFPHRVPPLAGGANVWAIDPTTGLPALTCPAGSTFTPFSYAYAADETMKGVTYFDGQPFASFFVDTYTTHYQHEIAPDYYEPDPFGLLPHVLSVNLINQSANVMEASFMVGIKFIVVGTERPETKTVKCRVCGHEHVVDRRATRVRCPECEELTMYYPILYGGERPIVEEV